MKKIIIIVGTRPNFIKGFPVYRSLEEYFDLTLIHTGQHYDDKMSDIFFRELEFPEPDIYLNTQSKSQSGQLGEIITKLEYHFNNIMPDLVLVFGDVTSTLAGALCAHKMGLKVGHVEAGLRSYDLEMPEEINRLLTDRVTDIFFCSEMSGIINLKNENLVNKNAYFVGNTMIDTQHKFKNKILSTKYWKKLNLSEKDYILITLHRPSNVDNKYKLKEIFDELMKLSENNIIVCPLHHRTRNALNKINYLDLINNKQNLILIDPLGYLEFSALMMKSKCVITDSGGVQEETAALKIPCFTLRENTERPATLRINGGSNILCSKISDIDLLIDNSHFNDIEKWDGNASLRIRDILLEIL